MHKSKHKMAGSYTMRFRFLPITTNWIKLKINIINPSIDACCREPAFTIESTIIADQTAITPSQQQAAFFLILNVP